MSKPKRSPSASLQDPNKGTSNNDEFTNQSYFQQYKSISSYKKWLPIILGAFCVVWWTLTYSTISEASNNACKGNSQILVRNDEEKSTELRCFSQNIINRTISPKPISQLQGTAVYTITTEIQPSNTIDTIEPTVSGTPNIAQNFINEIIDSAANTVGTIIGFLIAVLSILVLLLFGYFVLFRIRRRSKQLVLQAFQLIGNGWVEDAELVVRTQRTFIQTRIDFESDLSYLRGRIDYRSDLARFYLNLEKNYFSFEELTDAAGLNFNKLSNAASPDPKDVKVQFSVGPFQFSGFSLPKKLLNPPFRLVINSQPSTSGKTTLTSTLTWKDQVWYSKTFNILKKERDETIISITRDVAWAFTKVNSNEIVRNLNELPSEIEMILGIHELSRFMKNPRDISLLEAAQNYFNKIAEKNNRWSFQARFLSLISRMLLTKSRPKETAELFIRLMQDYSDDNDKKRILPYYVGQAIFYQYARDEYPMAIMYFNKINRPLEFLWKINKPVWWFVLKLRIPRLIQGLVLYYLAQCSIAITLAHQIDRRDKSDKGKEKNEHLRNKTELLVAEIMDAIIKLDPLIGNDIAEIQWRALNAQVMLAINLRQNFDIGIKAAEEALSIAPYALDVKANLGSLKIYSAAQRNQEGDSQQSEYELSQANGIFEELERLGWDLGFVKYRLGIIRRVQGRFNDALRLFQEAKNPNIKNVSLAYIDAEIEKAKNNDNSNTLD